MVTKFGYSFILLVGSTISIAALFVYIFRMKNKGQIHKTFLMTIFSILVWNLGHIFEVTTTVMYGYTNIYHVYAYYLGLIFTPVALLFTGLVFVYTKIKFNWKYALLLVFPVVDFIALITNSYHGLYFIEYSVISNQSQYGIFFTIHTIIQYCYILASLYLFIRFSIKNAGFFSKQSFLIILGVSVPFVFNILLTTSILHAPMYLTPVSFAVTIFLFSFAILRLNFLNITPIAMQRIVDLISDSFIIINQNFEVIDYNETFIRTFSGIFLVKRRDNLMKLLESVKEFGLDPMVVSEINAQAIQSKETQALEKNFKGITRNGDDYNKFFTIEVTPIYNRDDYLGTIFLFKDITQSKRDLETIKTNQTIIMEQERMASLGHLIGGIAHNLKTPIMSIAGGIEGLKELVEEYDNSIGDEEVVDKDHHEIAKEMMSWLGKMGPYCSYMSDIISTVKGQAAQFNTTNTIGFSIDELLKRVDLLMKHELNRFHCALSVESHIDRNSELIGEVSSLVQIFDNIIINSIHAYDGQSGVIELRISEDDRGILFAFKDHGKGMPTSVKERLFTSMVTTKGKEGTGLGLYMSYATIKGRFGGDMWFESEEGEGTTFFVLIPKKPRELTTILPISDRV
jgi:signal transduction histidine kinase